jgi:hypothetical protein
MEMQIESHQKNHLSKLQVIILLAFAFVLEKLHLYDTVKDFVWVNIRDFQHNMAYYWFG